MYVQALRNAPVLHRRGVVAHGSKTLFQRIGGKPAITLAADRFYDRVVADPALAPFFKDTDMKAQHAKQVSFLSFVLGGTEQWRGKSMRDAHKHLDLNDGHFTAVARHLQETLVELGVEEDVIQQVMETVASTENDVLDR